MSEVLCKECGNTYSVRQQGAFIVNGGDHRRCIICLEEDATINLSKGKENREAGQPGDWQKEVEEG
mgnify:CR=1 FL=1